MSATDLLELVRQDVPIGLLVVSMLVIRHQFKLIMKFVDDRDKHVQEQNDKMLKLMESRIATDVKHSQAFKALSQAVERLLEKL